MAFDGGVEGVEPWVVDDAHGGLAIDGESEGDTGARERVDEVGCAVNRVDDESWLRAELHARLVCLLAHEGDVRKG